ncbi:MAG: hypothetical protein DWQ31_08950 [Planctomycetota bacterium]|nr:MAG: hypothetical protein DWQ31_08950 [Planctomycetota bacterium]REJ91419.1 MAG: hypothetical protein DWQ35_14815 [Planctomycetota bacterium]
MKIAATRKAVEWWSRTAACRREILTGAGRLKVQQGRVRDNSPNPSDRVQFTPSVLPAYLRRADAIEESIPWLYLKGVSTGDSQEALQAIVGEKAVGLSANVVVCLKQQWADEYDEWCRRDLSEKQYVYVWADGIHVKVRLEDDANKKQSILVVMGATADGRKELIAGVENPLPFSRSLFMSQQNLLGLVERERSKPSDGSNVATAQLA